MQYETKLMDPIQNELYVNCSELHELQICEKSFISMKLSVELFKMYKI
jgi:hypothetical protein